MDIQKSYARGPAGSCTASSRRQGETAREHQVQLYTRPGVPQAPRLEGTSRGGNSFADSRSNTLFRIIMRKRCQEVLTGSGCRLRLVDRGYLGAAALGMRHRQRAIWENNIIEVHKLRLLPLQQGN